MKHIGIGLVLLVAGLLAITPSAAFAQNHGEVGVFGHFLRNTQTTTNFGGVGARVSFNAFKYMQLEGEASYDFEQAFSEGFTSPTTGTISITSSPLRVLQGLVGPKIQTGGGPVRLFATVKGGVINFRFDPSPVTFGTFTSSVQGLRADDLRGVLYYGGGGEAYLGPIGLRLDVGDSVYWQGGSAHHNLGVSFGPHIRF